MRIASTLVSSAAVSGRARRSTRQSTGWGRSCSVRLERLLLDAERRTCWAGGRTYKLRTTKPATTPNVINIYQCHHCNKQFKNKLVLKKHVHIHSPLHNSMGEDLENKKPKYSNKKYKSDCYPVAAEAFPISRVYAILLFYTTTLPSTKLKLCKSLTGENNPPPLHIKGMVVNGPPP
ncbi:uncharacterized protein LOC134659471 [Cydia amplana]|uniref:uncharacterized protein LOC134659471 n=1 Tax=Cydia amplana TaxID=1869771 RepID=UPI002FE59F9E